MSRLLFAAARGARIQYKGGYIDWREAEGEYKTLCNKPGFYRIHPDDEHMQYGPISTALREMAETGKEPYTLSVLMAMAAFEYESPYPLVLRSEWPHAQMLLLILAEALADEGL
jgi:hypothetical protein